MENQTRFDLNVAIENWRQELAGQPSLVSDDRRELETHLRDAIAGFQQRGLNDEESFWLAHRRVGQPQQLGEEFEKADPAKIWRERVFWMWLAVFLSSTLGRLAGSIGFALTPVNTNSMVEMAPATTLILLASLIPIIIAVSLAKGKWVALFSKLARLVGNRRHLAVAAFLCVALSSSIQRAAMAIFYSRHNIHNSASILQGLAATIYLLFIALLLVWLMPTQKQKTSKCA
ncbi:MAG: permease prefix domain 1-containing protein [Verrucomicrobiia bacterium]